MGDQRPIGDQPGPMPEGARETDYTKLQKSDLMRLCSDDPWRWAAAFRQCVPDAESLGYEEVAQFFEMMLEHAADVRRARAAERGPGDQAVAVLGPPSGRSQGAPKTQKSRG